MLVSLLLAGCAGNKVRNTYARFDRVRCASGLTGREAALRLLRANGVEGITVGKVGGLLALIGVVACPISSGDTAYRSARLTIADWFKVDQSSFKKRLLLTIPLLGIGAVICHVDYSMVWRYFSWSNQTLAMIMLWAAAVYLAQRHKNYWICALPAAFMSAVSMTYFAVAPECLGILWKAIGLEMSVYYPIGVVFGIVVAFALLLFFMKKVKPYSSMPALVD